MHMAAYASAHRHGAQVVHLKRFSFSVFRRDKITTNVRFPVQGLDISQYCAAGARHRAPVIVCTRW